MSNTMKEQMKVTIDYAAAADYAGWLPHWQGYQEFYKVELSDEVTQTTWDRFLSEEHDQYCIVAKVGDEIVGFAHFLFHPSTWAVGEYCYLEDLFVSPTVRGQQVGKQLIDFLTNVAKERDCARVYWHTQETNHRAQRLYDWIADKPGMIKYQINLPQD